MSRSQNQSQNQNKTKNKVDCSACQTKGKIICWQCRGHIIQNSFCIICYNIGYKKCDICAGQGHYISTIN